MRKTQVALAALTLVASSAALAEGVTLYGNVEAAVVSGNNGAGTRFGGAGEWGASVFGIKGSEDLGSGLKAQFNLEGGFDTNFGTNNNGGTNGIFNRAANLGLSTGFGTITAGVQVSPLIASYVGTLGLAGNNFLVPVVASSGAIDAADASLTTPTAAQSAVRTGGFFISNAVSYSNAFGPLSVSILGATKNGNEFNSYTGANATYSGEGFTVTAAYADRKTQYKNWLVGGTYSLGDLKLAANYINHKDEGVGNDDRKTYVLGVSYALGGGNTIGVNYARTNVTGTNEDPRHTNVSFQHALSKRTSLYAFYNHTRDSDWGPSYTALLSTSATRGIGAGIAHSF